jgi:hypothetical protein
MERNFVHLKLCATCCSMNCSSHMVRVSSQPSLITCLLPPSCRAINLNVYQILNEISPLMSVALLPLYINEACSLVLFL